MKTLTLIILAAFSLTVLARDCETTRGAEEALEKLEIKTDVPKWLEGATITVRLANGKESTVPAEQFKVVPRKQQFIVTKTRQFEKTVCGPQDKPNRISVLGGAGPKGNLTSTQVSPNKAQVETGPGVVGGIMYQRKLTDDINIGGQVQTNGTGMFSFGLDF